MSAAPGASLPSDVAERLDARFGADWRFDVRLHDAAGGEPVVEGELSAAGRRVSHAIALAEHPELSALGFGAGVERASARSLEACLADYDAEPRLRTCTPEALAGVAVDPVTLRVIGGAFNAIAGEMAEVLYRMSWSSIIRESEDLGCGLFDPEGREICESESSPMHIGSLPAYIRGFMERLDGRVHDGDVIIHNHPYHGASHTPDMGVALPIFHRGELLGFAAATAHLIDVGAATPGVNVDLLDVYAEGTLFNAIKLYERGRRNEEVWRLLQDSVRTPEFNAADIEAMIAAVRLGRERFLALAGKYGAETVMATAYHWMDYSERRLRAEIEKVPDGDYYAESWLDNDGRNWDTPLKVAVTVRVRGSDVVIDLTGSADEVNTAYNVPFEGSLQVGCFYAIRTLMLDDAESEEFIPQNDGMFRPISAVAPKGSIFNPNFPRACTSRMGPDPARHRLRDPRPGAGDPGAGLGRQRRHRDDGVLFRLQRGAAAILGVRRDQRRLLRRARRQGRPRHGRQPARQHAQRADRGSRDALSVACRALRDARRAAGRGALARRHRRHPRGALPGRRLHVGQRRPPSRGAGRPVRRRRRHAREADPEPGPVGRGSAAVEGDRRAHEGGRFAPLLRGHGRRLRRPIRARPAGGARRLARRPHQPRHRRTRLRRRHRCRRQARRRRHRADAWPAGGRRGERHRRSRRPVAECRGPRHRCPAPELGGTGRKPARAVRAPRARGRRLGLARSGRLARAGAAARPRDAGGAAARGAGRRQGRDRHRRHADQLRQRHLSRPSAGARCRLRDPPQGGRRPDHGQDGDHRVRVPTVRARRATRARARTHRAARRAARPRRWPPPWCPRRSAPRPAAR